MLKNDLKALLHIRVRGLCPDFPSCCDYLTQHRGTWTQARQAQGVRKIKITYIKATGLLLFKAFVGIFRIWQFWHWLFFYEKWKYQQHKFHSFFHLVMFFAVLIAIQISEWLFFIFPPRKPWKYEKYVFHNFSQFAVFCCLNYLNFLIAESMYLFLENCFSFFNFRTIWHPKLLSFWGSEPSQGFMSRACHCVLKRQVRKISLNPSLHIMWKKVQTRFWKFFLNYLKKYFERFVSIPKH